MTDISFQDLVLKLQQFWADQGCILMQPLDIEVGAGTFHPATFLGAIGPEPMQSAYVQPSRRPTDGRYGENPNRLQHYFQYQVILKPSPGNIQQLYLDSLSGLGIDFLADDIRFVEDNWESPTLGAWGLGWEVWLNGMEVTQFTYFQQIGGLDCRPVTGEITYGLERIAMYLQGVDSVYDLVWTPGYSYRDVYHQNEVEMSAYNFEYADTDELLRSFSAAEAACQELLASELPLPAYEKVLKASHTFNLLDARKAIGVTERARYIGRIRALARGVAESYFQSREALGFPRGNGSAGDGLDMAKKGKTRDTETLLVELGTEELPPRSLQTLATSFADSVWRNLVAESLVATSDGENAGNYHWYATPRRLAVRVFNVSKKQPSTIVERRGPSVAAAFGPDGNPTPAANGFAGSCGVPVSQLQSIDTPKGKWLIHRQKQKGNTLEGTITAVLERSIAQLPIRKRMRWGGGNEEFVRPVHWLVALHGNRCLNTSILSVISGNQTRGHRFHADRMIAIPHADKYAQTLRSKGRVIADFELRRDKILEQVQKQAATVKGRIDEDQSLLDEVTGLVEWPSAVLGEFDRDFLEIPQECLVSSMRDHQKYFHLTNRNGRLLPYFITVSNIRSKSPARVRNGNQRVLRARLSDARFFWETDLKHSLASLCPQLETVMFHEALGSTLDKTRRLEQLAIVIADEIGAEVKAAGRAALLSKADLVSGMVGEFPELQGVMGRYYAELDKEEPAVSVAIEQHYWPRFAGDRIPADRVSQAVSLADKIDTLVGIFSTGEEPTGEKDPYGLRRAALGVLRILVEGDLGSGFGRTAQVLCRKLQGHKPDPNQ